MNWLPLRKIAAVLAFGSLAVNLHAAPPPGWTAQNLGTPPAPGTVNFNAATGQTTVTGPGHSIEYGSDQFQFVNQPMQGDGEVIARVVSITNPASYLKAGLMLRTSLTANSAFVEVAAVSDGVNFRYRPTAGTAIVNDGRQERGTPVWMKFARLGNRVTAFTSTDGLQWTDVGSTDELTLPATIYAGLSVTSSDFNGGGVATFDQLAIRQTAVLPTGTTVSLVGPTITAGSATTDPGQPGSYVLSSNGGNLSGQTPGFVFVNVPFSGDGEISARITGLSTVAASSAVGLMVRDSLQPNALYGSVSFSQQGLRRQHINELDGNPTNYDGPASPGIWLKMKRHGALLSALFSMDGIAWQPLGKPFAIGLQPSVLFGLTMVGGSSSSSAFAQATVDHLTWPQAAPAGAALDPVIAAGLVSWRKADANGVSCVDCHTPFAYDIAQFSFTRADVRLATTLHLPQMDADAIFDMIAKLRVQYPPAGGLKDFHTFRPLQPGHGQIVGGENATANERDAAFGFYLKDHFLIGKDRITNLVQARAAAQELIDVNTATVPVGLKFNLWSRSVLREGPVTGGEVAEWIPSAGVQPKPAFRDYWFTLQDNYLRDPTDDNFWAIYHASSLWTQIDSHNFVQGTTHNNWRYVVTGQYLANSLFAHDELRKARGLSSFLAAEDGVRPFLAQRDISHVDLAPFWIVGDNARVVQGGGFDGMTQRNKDTVSLDLSYNNSSKEVAGWQINDFRLTWFWIGWNMDNSLRFSGEGSTLSGEYFIGSLWSGEVDNAHTGDSDSSHGFRMHQVFFNAVQQFKLGYKPGAWRDNDGPQHFEASKGYYLGYYRWHPRPEFETVDIGLPGANAQYKRLLSNHLRMAILIHTDEARKAGGVYYGEQYTISDLPLWRDALHWADPDWAQADDALLADLKSSLNPPLTATEMSDADQDGASLILENALGTSPTTANGPGYVIAPNAGGHLAITFTRARADYTYVVEISTDLVTWNVLATNPGNAGASVTVADDVSTSLPRRFLRLRVINSIL